MEYPVYKAVIDDGEGIMKLSLVKHPAVESMVEKFEKVEHKFEIDDEKQNIRGLIMACDRPILRRYNDIGFLYYIVFDRQALEKMARQMIRDTTGNIFTFYHDDNDPFTAECMEVFFKDSEKGINPKGYEDIEEGSMFGTFHIEDKEVWDRIKNEDLGISLEGIYEIVPVADEYDIVDSELDELINKLQTIIDRKK